MRQPMYYQMLAKAIISNADGIGDAIDQYLAKADEDLEDQLKDEGYLEPKATVEAINSMEEDIADILHDQTDAVVEVLQNAEEEGATWKIVQQRIKELEENDDIAAQVTDAAQDMYDTEVTELATSYIKESDGELTVSTLRARTSSWISEWSAQLGELMKISTHESLTSLIQDTISNGDSIATLTQKILEGGWRSEYYQAKRVAVTEVLRAHSVAAEEGIQQSPACDRREWRHTGAHKNNPRPNHVAMDHQIVAKDEPFELLGRDGTVYHPMYPRDSILPASESVNCHCIHRGIANDDILGMSLEERRAMQQKIIEDDDGQWEKDLDSQNKAKAGIDPFDESESSKVKYDYEASVIDRKQIASSEYQKKFDSLGENKKVTRSIRAKAKEILRHRSGTMYEDLSYVDTKTGKSLINTSYDKASTCRPSRTMTKALKAADDYTVVGIHNHPNSSIPSIDDIRVAAARKYKYGVVVGHNGTIFKYTINGTVNEMNADIYLAKANSMLYNEDTEGLQQALEELSKNGVDLEVF
ncbi:MAG: phage head morphogenesis protein [Clostridiales bacterium]|nr:phage head morphogenesis protein [Clostridiales bacterium]